MFVDFLSWLIIRALHLHFVIRVALGFRSALPVIHSSLRVIRNAAAVLTAAMLRALRSE
jgi:hypothetical protein